MIHVPTKTINISMSKTYKTISQLDTDKLHSKNKVPTSPCY